MSYNRTVYCNEKESILSPSPTLPSSCTLGLNVRWTLNFPLECFRISLFVILCIVHVISVKHFTSGYQSEILHAVYIPSKLRNSTGRQPVNPQMWSGRSKPPTSQCKICKLL